MSSIWTRLAVAMLAVACFAGTSQAQQYSCKGEIVATGNGALSENGAKDKAIKAWRNQVVTSYGVFWGEFNIANEGKGGAVERCARSLLGLMVCQARGRPCLVPSGGTEISCDKHDSPNCDPTVKWIQTRLEAKGYDISVDGSAGPRTSKAISSFKKKSGLGEGDDIDDKLIEALKS